MALGAAGLLAASATWAAAGAPLPRCSASAASFYLMQYTEATAPSTAPTTTLSRAAVPATGAVTLNPVWSGQTAPTPSPRDLSRNAGATVAGGMANDGYIYAMRAVGTQEPGWDLQGGLWTSEWRTHTRHYEMLRYGRDGVDNLGIVDGLGIYLTSTAAGGTSVTGAIDARLGPNFNAADVDPVTGVLYLASFQTGGALNRVFRIDITQSPPKYLSTLDLSSAIPGTQSGDFAIDAAGEWAYGVANTSFTGQSYRFNLATGVVQSLGSTFFSLPFGGAARLLNDPSKFAFYGFGTRVMTAPAGTLGNTQATSSADSADAASCLPKFIATLQCTPTDLVDADGQVANCTVALNQPAPAGGVAVALTPAPASPRYSTTCGSSVTVAAGATSAACTVTATPNTVPGDGDVTATVQLSTPDPSADYELGTPTAALVTVRNDDLPSVSLSCAPDSLFDSPGQTATCTLTANAPAPAGGLTVGLVPPTANPRYTTTCGDALTLAAGATTATCTVTAVPNTVPADGDVPAVVSLATPAAGAGYQLGAPTQATVLVRNDDAAPPVAQVVCTPDSLVDAAGQVATCTVSLSEPAPAGGVNIVLAPPASNPRYTTSCASPLLVAAGATTASCLITATANTVPGDGDVSAVLGLLPGSGYTVGPAAQATVTVRDDDRTPHPVPTLGGWSLLLLALGLGWAARRRA
ncbi:hypothetical protein CCO03_01435 [Comamonas serinivorans]|uniref:IPTL-CTERM protein sorting domain-containing protein n=2 Tax=Comamonas serinivorans TaxID=1082851 RepID=A0A1Y0EIR7_9BURK|nr:hypothetical protein CCO03_01435 [Comamonas serinivorans]